MPFYERQDKILNLLADGEETSLSRLAGKLFISLPTLRRDLIKLEERGLVERMHGRVRKKRDAADVKVPFSLREESASEEKIKIAIKAARLVKDGDTVMLDGSTSAYCIIPYLKEYKDILVITSGAKASLLLAHLGIPNISTGGRMINSSFSYVGEDAVKTILSYNADVSFFSCRGLSEDGIPTDSSAEENEIRRAMISRSKKHVLLCDRKKLGKTYLNNLCKKDVVDLIITGGDEDEKA